MHYYIHYTRLEGKFWVPFPSTAPQGLSKKAFAQPYWGREQQIVSCLAWLG